MLAEAHAVDQLHAVHARHLAIDHEQVEGLYGDVCDCGRAIFRVCDGEAEAPQQDSKVDAVILGVVHHQGTQGRAIRTVQVGTTSSMGRHQAGKSMRAPRHR